MEKLKIVFHPAHLGYHGSELPIVTALRIIAIGFHVPTEQRWWEEPDKYGITYENDVFLIHPNCGCQKNDGTCLWCLHGDHPDFDRLLREKFSTEEYQHYAARHYYDPPHFWYKPSDFRLTWYKYIGRDMATNMDSIPPDFLDRIFSTHPTSKTVQQALDELIAITHEKQESWNKMMQKLTKE